jgi:hypothetical protein
MQNEAIEVGKFMSPFISYVSNSLYSTTSHGAIHHREGEFGALTLVVGKIASMRVLTIDTQDIAQFIKKEVSRSTPTIDAVD